MVARTIPCLGPDVEDENMKRRRQPNLLVLGASGNVARAVLRRLGGQRCHFGRLVLMDKNRRVVDDAHLDHARLDYHFVRHRLALPADTRFFRRLLKQHRIDIVLDVSIHPTLPMLDLVNAAGVAYINTSLNDAKLEAGDLVHRLYPGREKRASAPRILGAGMNPGIVELWVRHGVARFGVPRKIIHFEFDDSMTLEQWQPLVTWSKHEFLVETTWNRTGEYDGQDIRFAAGNALYARRSLGPVLNPILPGPRYPQGFLVLHEENLTLGRALGVPSQFIYALHPRTMRHLVDRHRRVGDLREGDLVLGDNISARLNGTDMVGVCLQYPRRRVYYLNRLSNNALIGTNATCHQVAVGVFCALFTLLYDRLPARTYFAGDLYNTLYRQLAFANMRVELFICARRKGRWVRRKYLPAIRVPAVRDARHVVL